MPGGICLSTVCEIAVTCALAVRMSTSGLEEDLDDADAGIGLGLDVLDVVDGGGERALERRDDAARPSRPAAGRCSCQTTPMTGMLMSGKMSVGVRSAASGPTISSSSASTTNV